MNNQFKVGDRVKFRTWDEMKREFGFAEPGCINCFGGFTTMMIGLCGTEATIKAILSSGRVELEDFTYQGPKNWGYSLDMIKPIENDVEERFDALQEFEEWLNSTYHETDRIFVTDILEIIKQIKEGGNKYE